MHLDGKICVITGGSSGIGRRTALDLARLGATVCVTARREDRLKEVVDEMGGTERGHSYLAGDVSDRDHVRALVDQVHNLYGRCHILVNNAGFTAREKFTGPEVVETTESIMATNFFGAVYCTAEFLPLLEASAPANVVNVASVAGRLAVGIPAYTASKFALVGWTEALAPELRRKGIYLSSVEPGFIPTEGFPHKGMQKNLMRFILGSEAQVSKAIQDAIHKRKIQRVVPRWYYLLQLPRHLTPNLFFRFRK